MPSPDQPGGSREDQNSAQGPKPAEQPNAGQAQQPGQQSQQPGQQSQQPGQQAQQPGQPPQTPAANNPQGQKLVEQGQQLVQQGQQLIQQGQQFVQQGAQQQGVAQNIQQGQGQAPGQMQGAQQSGQILQQGQQPSQPQAQQGQQPGPAQKPGAKSEDKKPEDKKPEDKKSEDKKPEDKKDGDKKDDKKKGQASEKADADKKEKEEKKGPPKPLIILIVLLIIGALVIFQIIRNKPEGKSGWLRISGRIEGYEVNVGAKIAGRVEMIANREGEEVIQGQPIVRLSDQDIQAQLRGAKARYEEAIQSVNEAQEQLKSSKEQVDQAKLNVKQAIEDAKGRVDQAEANVANQLALTSQARSNEIQAKADLELARVRKQRYDELVVKGAVTQDEDDQAHATFDSAGATVEARKAAVVAAERQVSSARAALLQAKSNLLNPPIRRSQQSQNSTNVAQNEAALLKAKHDVNNAKAAIDEIAANIQYLNINSPIHGVVTARTVEPGAVVAAGQTVLSLIDLKSVFLRAYVPDSEIGKVRLGQRALIYYDSDPKKGLEARVIEIDPQASFTPENIYFRDDRVKQVFGIKIMIKNPAYFAKPGMPADADVDVLVDDKEKTAHAQQDYVQPTDANLPKEGEVREQKINTADIAPLKPGEKREVHTTITHVERVGDDAGQSAIPQADKKRAELFSGDGHN